MAARHENIFPFYSHALSSLPKRVRVKFNRMVQDYEYSGYRSEILRLLEDMENKNPEGLREFLSDSLAGIQLPLHLSLIKPYNVYVPEVLTTESVLVAFICYSGGPVASSFRSTVGYDQADGTIDAIVTIYDYDSLITSFAYLEKEGFVVYESPDGFLLHNSSGITKEWWTVLNTKSNFKDATGIQQEFIERKDTKSFSDPVSVLSPNSVPVPSRDFPTFGDSANSSEGDPLYDADPADIIRRNAGKPAVLRTTAQVGAAGSNVEATLETMLKTDDIEGVPCLAGLSGVAKSAIVKSVARKNNWRMVDFRAAFLHRLDMEGLNYLSNIDSTEFYSLQSHEQFEKYTNSAYFADFAKCSDEYIDYANGMVSNLEAIKASTGDDEYKPIRERMQKSGDFDKLDELIAYYREEARPVVLFFDEIIRAPKKILNLFTIMLTDKRVGKMNFRRTKIVAAANAPIGFSESTDLSELFVGQEVKDAAIFERLKVLLVSPEMVYPSWLTYIKKAGWDQEVIDHVSKGLDVAYGLSVLRDRNLTVDEKRESVYPTFRAWEQISRILTKHREENVPIFKDQILGLLGERHGWDFINSLGTRITWSDTSSTGASAKDGMTVTLDSCMDMGIPIGLFGPSGFGKTHRVMRLAKKKNWEVITIQLSQKSLSDIMGQPHILSMGTLMSADSAKIMSAEGASVVSSFSNELAKNIEGLPPRVTTRAPLSEIREKIIRLRAYRAAVKAANEKLPQDKRTPLPKLVLFFDEVNRFTEDNKSIQSALFEAISDHRFAGVDFDPDEVVVVAAANVNWAKKPEDMGTETEDDRVITTIYGDKQSYEGVQPIDSALRLRLCSFDKQEIDIFDAAETREFIVDPSVPKDRGFHPVIRKYFASLTDEQIRLLMKSVEWKSEMNNVPSIRSFASLSACMFKQSHDFSGGWFFPTRGVHTQFAMEHVSNPEDDFQYINKPEVISNWVCLRYPDICIPEMDGLDSVTDTLDMLKWVTSLPPLDIASHREVISQIAADVFQMEVAVKSRRQYTIESFLGGSNTTEKAAMSSSNFPKVVLDLLDYINASGVAEELIEIDQIVDRPTANKWVAQTYREEKMPSNLVKPFKECLGFLFKSGRYDCVAYVIAGAMNLGDPGVFPMVLDTFYRDLPFVNYDGELAPFNRVIADAVKSGPSKSLGRDWDSLVAGGSF